MKAFIHSLGKGFLSLFSVIRATFYMSFNLCNCFVKVQFFKIIFQRPLFKLFFFLQGSFAAFCSETSNPVEGFVFFFLILELYTKCG